MFLVFGILSVLAGVFIFTQADRVTRLMAIINAHAEIGATFTAIAICFLLS